MLNCYTLFTLLYLLIVPSLKQLALSSIHDRPAVQTGGVPDHDSCAVQVLEVLPAVCK